MSKTVLVLGASGRFGRHATAAFERRGWQVRAFHRDRDTLADAARGSDVIVNGWNPAYPAWRAQVPALTAQVIGAAKASGATVIVPANIYVYGAGSGPVLGAETPHRARNPLGRVRIEMEAAYRDSGVGCIMLRAGDFIDTQASENWFDKVMTPHLDKGRFTYPGRADIAHAWAFLPDLAAVAVHLAERRHSLGAFADIAFPGYTLNGQDMARALAAVWGHAVALKPMNWRPLALLSPVWPMARHLREMRYLWNMPHQLDGAGLRAVWPGFQTTPLETALRLALNIDPDQTVA